MVRMWRASYAGTIRIDAPVQLLRSGDPEREENPADGIRITVEHEGRELKAITIDANDYREHAITGLENISVQPGERIFFRLQSVENGSYDSVHWSPIIEYQDEDLELTDANGKPLYQFSSAEDFLLSADQQVTAPINGRIMVAGNFFKPQTSDDVRFEILKNPGVDQDTIWSKLYGWDVEVDSALAVTVEANKDDIFVFRISSETNVDVSSITWTPLLYYSASYDPAYERVVNDEGEPLINFYPIPRYSMYPIPYRITEPSQLATWRG